MSNSSLNIINKIDCSQDPTQTNGAEKVGDFLLSPARIFFGRTYTLENNTVQPKRYLERSDKVLASNEEWGSFGNVSARIVAIILLPLSLIAVAFGSLIKGIDLAVNEKLKEKYKMPTVINARDSDNMTNGKLPPNPFTMNCVNSQEKSRWGALYDAEPIPTRNMTAPVLKMKQMLTKDNHYTLVEENLNYLHYTYKVEIPSGALKGTYIDDVDLYYNQEKQQFDIRSASRTGFRDAIHTDRTIPGANKKRIENIRAQFAKL